MSGRKAHRTLCRCSRYTPAEWRTVQGRAAEAGKPPASFVREAALTGQVIQAVPRRVAPADRAVHELARIGNNLNQLARAANASGRFGVEAQLLAALDELLTIIRGLR